MTADARDRILTCSRRLFSERTFAQVSLKDIAQEAEVSVALIVKHFQNKDSLFEATVDFSNSSEALFAGPFEELGRTAIRETLTAPHNAPYSMARMITVSTGNLESLNAIGKRIRSDLQEVLVNRIRNEAPHPNPSPEIRAQSALSLLLGLSMMRRFADTDFLAFSETTLENHYSRILQRIINGEAR